MHPHGLRKVQSVTDFPNLLHNFKWTHKARFQPAAVGSTETQVLYTQKNFVPNKELPGCSVLVKQSVSSDIVLP